MKRLWLLVAVSLSLTGLADTFLWTKKWDQRATEFYAFSANGNWSVTDGTGAAVSPHPDYPGTTDDIDYGPDDVDYMHFDMEGASRTVRGLANGFSKWQPHHFRVKNGTLTFTGGVGNRYGYFFVEDTGALVLTPTTSGRFGEGQAKSVWEVKSGGSLELYGSYTISAGGIKVQEGGVFTLDPVSFGAHSDFCSDYGGGYLENHGTLNLPHGLIFGGTGSGYQGRFEFRQMGGTLTIGGDLAHDATLSRFPFILSGGTIHATDDVNFTTKQSWLWNKPEMTADATAAVDVDAGKILNLADMQFGENTTLVKKGAGAVVFGASKPTKLQVSTGGVYTVPANTALGGFLELAEGSILELGGAGISATSLSGVDNATVRIAANASLTSCSTVFTSTDAELMKIVARKLAETSSGLGTFSIYNGGVYFDKKHEPTVFAWKKANYTILNSSTVATADVTPSDFMDPANWAIGTNPYSDNNTDRLIPSAGDGIYVDNANMPLFSFDMNGQTRTIADYDRTGYSEKWGFNGFNIRNGTLEFTGNFTNTRAVVKAYQGGTFRLTPTCSSRFGNGAAQMYAFAKNGGTVELGGKVEICSLQAGIEEGGTMVFSPVGPVYVGSSFAYGNPHTYFDNNGTLSFPNGLAFNGPANQSNWGFFSITQHMGKVSFGGAFSKASETAANFYLRLGGGELAASADADLSAFTALSVLEGASVTFSAVEGATLDVRRMTYGANAAVTKTGAGTVAVDRIPSSLTVSEGALKLMNEVDFSAVAFAAGTRVVFGVEGCSANSLTGVENMRFEIDPSLFTGSRIIVLQSTDRTLLEKVGERLTGLPDGYSAKVRAIPGNGYRLVCSIDSGMILLFR